MASIVLGTVGTALGGPLGGFIGAALGSVIDNAVIGMLTPAQKIEGPRVSDIQIQTSTEGAAIPVAMGYCRLAGQIIWATHFLETKTVKKSGGGKGAPKPKTKTTEYTYSISFAVALCEGVVSRMGRIWANGRLIDQSKITMRFYSGTETQTADVLINQIEGTGNTPSYRGVSYAVFEDLELEDFGNQIPQLNFEVVRAIGSEVAGSLETEMQAVTLIPGAGEFVYSTTAIRSDDSQGTSKRENTNTPTVLADSISSLDDLEAVLPNVDNVAVVGGWFGDDLRCGTCLIKPKVETATKTTKPQAWKVNGIVRSGAAVVSLFDGLPSHGGTPSDASIVEIIAELKLRGKKVTFYPFLFMDIPVGNTLPNPYSDNAAVAGQPAYPWRGRITVSPAPGYLGTVNKTATASTQVDAFFGSATGANFSVNGTEVSWTGGTDWGYRRLVLHYAKLCAALGGVDAFLIGSELIGLTRSRSSAIAYPAVAKLKTLAADVKAILGGSTKVGYAADWSEWNAHQTGDVAGEVLFNLDPLWSDSNIDFIGIDNYLKLSDWRDGTTHLDYNAANGPWRIYDRAYLDGNIKAGEDYDWFYASDADRDSQTRSNITDGAYGKPWVYRQKDFWNWWGSLHYDRPGGVENGSPTTWVAESKPIWFTELGCPAIEKGSNQPNVFFDAKSSESFAPYYSTGERDDLIQRMFLETHFSYWADNAKNPASSQYSGRMVDTANIYVWTWDARPFPYYPAYNDVWSDGVNYYLGHWLSGRAGAVPLDTLVTFICETWGFADFDVGDLRGIVTGYMINQPMTARAAIEPLMRALNFDALETGGKIVFKMRGRPTAVSVGENDVVMPGEEASLGVDIKRAPEADLPAAFRVTYIEAGAEYRQATAELQRLPGDASRVIDATLPIMLDQSQAVAIGDRLIQQAWLERETATFSLPPSKLGVDPGDEIGLTLNGRLRRLRVGAAHFEGSLAVQAVGTDPGLYEPFTGPRREFGAIARVEVIGAPLLVFADLPLLSTDVHDWAPYMAAYASPWPGAVDVYRSPSNSGFELDETMSRRASLGVTTTPLAAGPTDIWDTANTVTVKLYDGTLASADELAVLGGANAIAIINPAGEWEVLQFVTATLVGTKTWTLSQLLRGQLGTEAAMQSPLAAGATVLVLDGALYQPNIPQGQFALPFFYNYGPSGQPTGSETYQTVQKTGAATGLRCYSPVHLAASRNIATNDVTFTWVRRDRVSGDAWEPPEIPMSETVESYEIDIYNGAPVVRTLTSGTPSALYTAAQQTADFGAPPASLTFKVYQLSSLTGRGTGRSATLTL